MANEATQLTDSEVNEIEARYDVAEAKYLAIVQRKEWWRETETPTSAISESLSDIPALIRDWRALRARLTACEGSRCVHELDNHHNALACGYCAGPLKNELTRLLSIEPEAITLREQNAALREQLAEYERLENAINAISERVLIPEVLAAMERLKEQR